MKAVESLTAATPTAYTFGDLVVERENFRLLKSGQVQPIEPRAFDVLIFLIEHRDRVVEKQELFDQIWKQSFVTDSALAQEIKNIRHALGDDAHCPRYIETVHKHGYRFIAGVADVASALPEPSPDGRQTLSSSAIAVLPFVNLSGNPDNDYFCDGLSEELIDRLTKLKQLRVVAHTSSFAFKGKDIDVREIGGKLKAGIILEGSVRRHGDRLRVSVQIVDASDGYHLSSESYDRQWEDLFAMQDEISLAVVDKLKVELLPADKTALVKRYTENVQAYHLYLKGRYFWNKRFVPGLMQKAIDHFQQAIQTDPQYALAYTGLADAYSVLGVFAFRPPREVFPLAKAMVDKAFQIESDLAEANTSRGIIHLSYDYDYAAAEREFKQALDLNPGYSLAHQWYSYCLTVLGRMDEALAQIDQAMLVDPISPTVNTAAGRAFCYARRYDESVQQLQKAIELDPQLSLAHFYLGQTYSLQGENEKALAAFQKAIDISGHFPWASSYVLRTQVLLGAYDKVKKVFVRGSVTV